MSDIPATQTQATQAGGADYIAPEDRVPVWEKTSLGVGALTSFFGYAAVSIMAYPVYNMMLGINAAWIGFALMIPRLWDAFIDPFMGQISDNTRSRFGRRRPYIVAGAWIMGILYALMWYIPTGWSESTQMAVFILIQIVYSTAFTVFSIPLASLSYELTPNYNERTNVMAFLAFFHKLGEFLGGWMLPFAVVLGAMILGNAVPRNADGDAELTMTGVHMMGWIIGIGGMAILGSLPGLFVRERFDSKVEDQPKVRLIEGAKAALASKPFIILVAIIILNTLSGVLAMGIDQYLLVYYMNGGSEAAGLVQKGLLTTGYAFVGFAAIPAITWLASKFDKKGSLFFVYGLMTFGGIMKWFIFTPGHPMWDINLGITSFKLDPIILIDPLLCGPMWVAVKIMLSSMMADIVDEDELRHGFRREGIFSSVFSWLEKMVVSLAALGTGLALTYSGFQPTLGANQPEGTFTLLRLFLAGGPASTAVFALIALYFYPITVSRAAETRRQLELRRGTVSLKEATNS